MSVTSSKNGHPLDLETEESSVVYEQADVRWQLIRPMPGQPREYFDSDALKELANSIKTLGQLVRIRVRRITSPKHQYEIIDGQRRWHAVQIAGIPRLRCEISPEQDEEKAYVESVVMNLTRESHHRMEIAVACDRIRKMKDPTTGKNYTLDGVAQLLGRSYSYVDQHLAILNLADELKKALHPKSTKSEKLPFSAAVMLGRLPVGEQLITWEKIKSSNTSKLRATRKFVAESPTVSCKTHERARHRDQLKSLTGLLGRTLEDLDWWTPERLELSLRARDPVVKEKLRSLLDRLSSKLGSLSV